jgi:hypothetical protein
VKTVARDEGKNQKLTTDNSPSSDFRLPPVNRGRGAIDVDGFAFVERMICEGDRFGPAEYHADA